MILNFIFKFIIVHFFYRNNEALPYEQIRRDLVYTPEFLISVRNFERNRLRLTNFPIN